MKASLKFREEKNPLLSAKLPFKVGPIPLSSGVAVGSSQELALHLGTLFPVGPSMKLAFKPNDSSPFSVVMKTGLGLWGSPNGAPLTLKAELYVTPKCGDPLFTLKLKPRVGDFGIRKDVNGVKVTSSQHKVAEAAIAPITPPIDKIVLPSSPLSTGDAKATPKRNMGNFIDKDRMRSPSVDTNAVVIGSNFSLKIEGLDKEWKGRNDKKQKADTIKEHDVEADVVANGNGTNVHSPDEVSPHERVKSDSLAGFSLASARSSLQGCRIVSHSVLPFGRQARLNIRWGVKPPTEVFQGWDGSLPSLSFSKLPSLLLDKVSFEQVSLPVEKPKIGAPPVLNSGYLEGEFLPVSLIEENRELAQVALLCYSMKRQLHLLYAENQVLRRSMEDMKSQVEIRGFRNTNGMDDATFSKEQAFSRPSLKSPLLHAPSLPHNEREEVRRESEARKGQRDASKRGVDVDVKPMLSMEADSEVSKELEKAIKSAKNGFTGGKKE